MTAAAAGDDDAAAPAATATPAATDSADSSDSTARWLGAGGLVVGVIGLLLAAVAWRRLATLSKAPAAGVSPKNSDSSSNTSQGSAV